MIKAFLVRGHSMVPQVQDRSLVLVLPFRRDPAIGEMVVYRSNQGGLSVGHIASRKRPRLDGACKVTPTTALTRGRCPRHILSDESGVFFPAWVV